MYKKLKQINFFSFTGYVGLQDSLGPIKIVLNAIKD